MECYFGSDASYTPFLLFSPVHLLTLSILAIITILFFRTLPSVKGTRLEPMVRYGLIFILMLSEVGWHAWNAWNQQWMLQHSLPLQLCSVTMLLSGVLLLT